jgi:hypothetical protein
MSLGQFVLVNLEGPGTYQFGFFPAELQTSSRVLWEPQEVTIGTKPLFYGNRDPKRITVDEAWLDGTRTGESISPDIEALQALQLEIVKLGRPPALLAIWGERQQRCVLEDLTIREQFFSNDGNPLRARVSLQLVELQEEGTAVGVSLID